MSPHQLLPAVGAAIRQIRRQRGLDVRAMATKASITPRRLRDIETGRAKAVHEATLLNLCAALGIDFHALTHESQATAAAIATSTPASVVDIYVSAPMASLGTQYIRRGRSFALAIVDELRRLYPAARVYCAAIDISSPDYFDDEAIALTDDLDALRRSARLLAYFPEPLVSSVLVEIGAALAIGIPTMILVRRKQDLPSLLRGGSLKYPFHVRRITDEASLLRTLRASSAFFGPPAAHFARSNERGS